MENCGNMFVVIECYFIKGNVFVGVVSLVIGMGVVGVYFVELFVEIVSNWVVVIVEWLIEF